MEYEGFRIIIRKNIKSTITKKGKGEMEYEGYNSSGWRISGLNGYFKIRRKRI
jgi:hypothetical protein